MSTRLIQAAQRSHLIYFVMKVFEELHPGERPLRDSWYIRAICHALETSLTTPGSRQVIAVPPRHLKSIAASVAFTAWALGRNPALRIMVATYSQDLARLHAANFRTIVRSDWYRRLFPEMIVRDDGDRLHEIMTTAGGGRKAVSVGGTVTGFGADVILVDDCMKADDVRSQARRDEIKAWYNGTLATRLNDLGGGAIISIQQRLHEDDLPAFLLEKGFKLLCLPAIAEKDEVIAIGNGKLHRRQIGDLLDPQRQSREQLEAERRNLGAQVFSAQFQQNPVAPQGNLIRLEWFGTYEDEEPERHWFRKVVQSWDTGMTAEPTSDYSVCTTWGFRDGDWWLLDVLRQRLDYPDLKKAVIRLRRLWDADSVVIEDAGSGKSLWQELKALRIFRPQMWRVADDKETRVIGITGQLAEGRFLLPSEAPWLDAFRSELRAFPNGKYDDQVDSVSQFVGFQMMKKTALEREYAPDGRPLYKLRRETKHRRR